MKRVSDSSIKAAATLFAIAVLLVESGCGGSAAANQISPENRPAPSTLKVRSDPVLIAVLEDQSGSMRAARTLPLREEELRELLDTLRKTTGELALGFIGEADDRPLLRVRITAPPSAPVRPNIQNVFERAEREAAFDEQMKHYEDEHRLWESIVDERINAFLTTVRQRLSSPISGRVSGIYAALDRAELFLGEQGPWPPTAHKYVALHSDGIDTTRHASVEIKSGARLLLINGSSSLGIFTTMKPEALRFESLDAAIDFVNTEETRR